VFCTQCGKQLLAEGVTYCWRCGAKVLTGIESNRDPPVTHRAGDGREPTRVPLPPSVEAVRRRTERTRRLVIGSGVGCALALVVASLVLAMLASRLAREVAATQPPEPPPKPYRSIAEAVTDNPTIRTDSPIVRLPGPIVACGILCALVVVLVTLAIVRRIGAMEAGAGDGGVDSGRRHD